MLVEILITSLLVIFAILIYLIRKPNNSKIYFVGPHSTGKTESLLSLNNIESKTVTTLADHKIIFKNKEITELVPNDSTNEFEKKFRLNNQDTFVFFIN